VRIGELHRHLQEAERLHQRLAGGRLWLCPARASERHEAAGGIVDQDGDDRDAERGGHVQEANRSPVGLGVVEQIGDHVPVRDRGGGRAAGPPDRRGVAFEQLFERGALGLLASGAGGDAGVHERVGGGLAGAITRK
jgi:hypothetical protein